MEKHRFNLNLLHKTAALLMAVLILEGFLSACGNSSDSGNVTTGKEISPVAVDSQSPDKSNDSLSGDTSEKESSAEEVENNTAEAKAVSLDVSATMAASLDPAVIYKEGEETVLDTDELSVTVTGYDPAYEYTEEDQDSTTEETITEFAVKLQLENKSKEEISVEYESCSVNGFGVAQPNLHKTEGEEDWGYIQIPAGEKFNIQLEFPVSALAGAGITSVDEVSCTLSDGQFDKEQIYGTFTVYPTGKKPEEVVKADPVSLDDINVFIDNEQFTFGIFKDQKQASRLFWPTTVEDLRIKFYVFNKTEGTVSLSVYEADVDGTPYYNTYIYDEDGDGKDEEVKEYISRDNIWTQLELLTCMPGCGAVGDFWVSEKFMEDNNISSLADISVFSIGLGVKSSGKSLFSGTLAFSPADGSPVGTESQAVESSGKENGGQSAYRSVDYVNTTDTVFENDAFKISAVGYDPAYVNPESWKETFMARLEIENKTDKDYTFGSYDSSAAVNRLAGFPVEESDQCTIPAGEKGEMQLFIDPGDFLKFGIQSVDEIRFTVSAESTEYKEARDAYYKDYNNEELKQKWNELDNSDRFVEFCILFPTGLKEEEIVPAVTLDDPDQFQKIGPYNLSCKKNQKGNIYDGGLELWFFNDSTDQKLGLSMDEVGVNGFVVQSVESDSTEADDYEEVYSYDLEDVPPLCVGHKQAHYSNEEELFLSEDVLRGNGIEEGTISLDFELSVNLSSGKQGSTSWETVYDIPVDIKYSKTGSLKRSKNKEEDKVSFRTTDIEGNNISSKVVFSGDKITMISLWTTWCGPFVKGLPELESLSSTFDKKGCRIVGICLDANDEKEKALSILQDADVTFLNLAAPENIKDVLPSNTIPTIYFVDNEGYLLSDPIEGVDIDLLEETLDSLLESMD